MHRLGGSIYPYDYTQHILKICILSDYQRDTYQKKAKKLKDNCTEV